MTVAQARRQRARLQLCLAQERPLLVRLCHPSQDVFVPEAALCSVSDVLEQLLRSTPTPEGVGYKSLSSQGVTLQQLNAFVALATMRTNSPSDPALTNTMLAFAADNFMPLIHIFDCRGLFKLLTDAVNEHPYGPSIMAILQYDNDDHRWLQPQTLRCLAAHLFPAPEGPNPRQAVMLTEANFRKTIDELPERVVRGLFYLVLTESKLASFGDAMHLVGAKGVAPE